MRYAFIMQAILDSGLVQRFSVGRNNSYAYIAGMLILRDAYIGGSL